MFSGGLEVQVELSVDGDEIWLVYRFILKEEVFAVDWVRIKKREGEVSLGGFKVLE